MKILKHSLFSVTTVVTITVLNSFVNLKSANAATLVTVSTQSTVYEDGVGTQSDSPSALTQLDITKPLTLSSSIATSSLSALANGQTTGAAGKLKAKTFGSASGSQANPGGASSGSSSSDVFVGDQITVTSSTLNNGAPVSILFSLLVDGSLPLSNSSNNPNFFGTATASFSGGNNSGANNQVFSLLFDSNTETNYTLINNRRQYDRVLSLIYPTAVGEVIPIGYQLITQATARTAPGQALEAFTDFGSTGLFYIDSQTPGVTLISESGHNYASPAVIPTPALLPGLVGMSIAAIRKRKQAVAVSEDA